MALWVKLYTDILGDPKLLRGARDGHKSLDLLPWLIIFAKKSDDDGRLSVGNSPASAADIAELVPGGHTRRFEQCLSSAAAIGVLTTDTDGAYRFVKWDDRQQKPSNRAEALAERQRRSRALKRHTPDGVTGVTESHPVTRQSREDQSKTRPEETRLDQSPVAYATGKKEADENTDDREARKAAARERLANLGRAS